MDSIQPTDAMLVEKSKAGDTHAFEQLISRYSRQAYSIAYSILNNREDAEEVAQDAFIRMLRAIKGFRGDAAFKTWMFRIVTNLAKNRYRWNKVRGSQVTDSMNAPIAGTEGEDALFIDPVDTSMRPDEATQFAELQQQINQALNEMPEDTREILIMRNIMEMSYENISETLNCKLGTVKSRLARAREELRLKLGL